MEATRAELVEQLGHLVTSARRVTHPAQYEAAHRRINDALDALEATPADSTPTRASTPTPSTPPSTYHHP